MTSEKSPQSEGLEEWLRDQLYGGFSVDSTGEVNRILFSVPVRIPKFPEDPEDPQIANMWQSPTFRRWTTDINGK